MRASNWIMSRIRIAVEWSFGSKYTSFFVSNRIGVRGRPVGKAYLVAALMHNCRVCLYGHAQAT